MIPGPTSFKLNKKFKLVDGVVYTKASAPKPAKKKASSGAAAGAGSGAGAGAGAGAGSAPMGGAGGPPPVWKTSSLSLEEKFALCRSVGQECVQEAELMALLEKKPHPVCYDGFEPSGRVHIAQGILKAINVNKLTSSGCVFKFWVADWFAMLNNKMGGQMKKIRVVGEYMIEVWKAAGMNMDNVQFLWASDEINKRPDEYWQLVMDIATKNNISRIKRCCTIMGRDESDEMSAAQIMYPLMQAADIFFLKADICQLGMDQRKVNMLAREYCDVCKPKRKFKPVILSHPMLMGLVEGQAKMSKSLEDSAIFMEDDAKTVARKIRRAYCPPEPEKIPENPVLNWTQNIVFGIPGATLSCERPAEEGGAVVYESFEDLKADYAAGKLHPSVLKPAVTKALNVLLEPVRKHFASGRPAELLKKVKQFRKTR